MFCICQPGDVRGLCSLTFYPARIWGICPESGWGKSTQFWTRNEVKGTLCAVLISPFYGNLCRKEYLTTIWGIFKAIAIEVHLQCTRKMCRCTHYTAMYICHAISNQTATHSMYPYHIVKFTL